MTERAGGPTPEGVKKVMWLSAASLLIFLPQLVVIWREELIFFALVSLHLAPLPLWLLVAAWKARRELGALRVALAWVLAVLALSGWMLFLALTLFAASIASLRF